MPKILTDVDAFSIDVTVPEGGDARTAASVEPAFQKLSNRTHYLNLRKAALAGAAFTGAISAPTFNYQTPLEDVQKVIPTARGAALSTGSRLAEGANGLVWQFDANSAGAIWPIELPHGSTLTAVVATVIQGNAGASGQMSFEVWKQVHGFPNVDTQLATETFTAGTGDKFETALVADEIINNITSQYYVWVIGSALAATNDDYLASLYVNFDVSGLVSN